MNKDYAFRLLCVAILISFSFYALYSDLPIILVPLSAFLAGLIFPDAGEAVGLP